MLYIAYFIIVSGHNINFFLQNLPFLTCRGGKLQFVHTPNAIEPPTNSNFEAFGGPMAQARWAQWPLRGSQLALRYPYCHQMITQTHPRGNRRVSEFQVSLNSLRNSNFGAFTGPMARAT